MACLDLRPLDTHTFEADPGDDVGQGRAFGGLLMAQALTAVGRLQRGAPVAQHIVFLAACRAAHVVRYTVSPLREGRTHAVFDVRAHQENQLVLSAIIECGTDRAGPEHGTAQNAQHGGWPDPANLRTLDDLRAQSEPPAYLPPERWPLEWRWWEAGSGTSRWFIRSRAPLPEDPLLHRAVLLFGLDRVLLGSALSEHPGAHAVASLAQTTWFHATPRLSEWHLLECMSPWAGAGRALALCTVRAIDGEMVATAAQQGLVTR